MAVRTRMGVKHPNVKKCAFMPALPPKATGLDVDSGTLTGVRCWRQLFTVPEASKLARGRRSHMFHPELRRADLSPHCGGDRD